MYVDTANYSYFYKTVGVSHDNYNPPPPQTPPPPPAVIDLTRDTWPDNITNTYIRE